ncbi:single-stranded-DNA-specific exonuclease RecJ [Psychrobacillus psychrodurans]|uniref:single-stranded-DNA-specific exonuclease RecJ n=1 Tax=Psychrobacillus psychrodurans TaxID=126157 RepID=UPI0008F34F8D|nr:single-stranded-DNA-specific exonuclease RecJ [Psychrobacillus psychrodurans]MCZ8541565.1 single-stranded-DNA-specific exonuclease RecJ [Psychrobacillus psychrodurans]SFN04463.1 single-stranded-DNA-specific exonuclease [Psychrobacillus psychrodurans]
MIKSQKKWQVSRPNINVVEMLEKELSIPRVCAKVLASRGFERVEDAKAFLHVTADQLHNPFLFPGMEALVARVHQAIDAEERIMVYGDYDADGITSTTIMVKTLESLGADVIYKIPNRFIDGYGPSERLFQEAFDEGVKLIITVDNGISGLKPIEFAKGLGMDVIVTDHHEPGENLPMADIIIHPNLRDSTYPFPHLAGVGVAFKVAHALLEEIPKEFFYLVAIGTIADLVSLTGENRYLVQQGLKQMQQTDSVAIEALANISGIELRSIDEETVGFMFGPRINAVGRLGEAAPGVDLFLTENPNHALALANMLNEKNKERQAIVKQITDEAMEQLEQFSPTEGPSVIVVGKVGWNPGVLGIVASKLVEKYYRPAIVLGFDEEKNIAKGSARSIEGFHMYKELAKNQDIVPHFGGHPMAAGMTLPLENVDELRARLNDQAQTSLTEDQLIPIVSIDVPLEMDEISTESIESLKKLAPFGMDFAKPVYCIENVEVSSIRKIGSAQNHLKMELKQDAVLLDAIGFGKGQLADEIAPTTKLSFIGDLQINEWNGRKKAQLMIQDVKTDEWQLFDIRGIRQVNRWKPLIPVEDTVYIAFNEQTIKHFSSTIDSKLYLVNELLEQPIQAQFAVLLDLPEDEQTLVKLMQYLSFKRIYAHFYTNESSYFEGLPTREQFKWYFSLLTKRKSFALKQHVHELSKHTGWSQNTFNFMSKVFFELNFVRIDNGMLVLNENLAKKDLSEAPSYKNREKQMELEQKLLYAPYIELKQWFEERRAVQTVPEEEQIWI